MIGPSVAELLVFEHTHRVIATSRETKIRAIRARFGWSESVYLKRLYDAIDSTLALVHNPTLTRTLRRERDERRATRTGTGTATLAPGPDPRQATLDLAPRVSADAAEAAKQRGMERAEHAATHAWKHAWDVAIESLAASGRRFTADDVREIAGDPTDHPNAAGSRFLRASKRGLIRKVAYRPSDRESLHGHNVAVWIGADVKEEVA